MAKKRLLPPVNGFDHIIGPFDAAVTLVEYGDFECPYSGEAYPSIRELIAQFENEMLFAFRHFPLSDIHPHAEPAAEAAEAAGAQGHFWEMYEMLFDHQTELDHASLMNYAEALALDLTPYSLALEEGAFAPRVTRDLVSGEESGVSGTPTFFLNGKFYDGSYTFEDLSAAVSHELSKAARRNRVRK